MREELVETLEEFVRDGSLWEPDQLTALIDRLNEETELTGDPVPAMLTHPFRALVYRLQIGPVAPRTAREVESIIYPRVWKVMEAARDGVPPGELRTRIEVLNRRLARHFVEETVT